MNDGLMSATPVANAEEKRFPVEFQGTAREYFGIWIVNILLTILTIGIYSAWAKVRRERYFHGNTHIAGHAFDYHARPLSILKGRLIVLGCLLIYVVLANLFPLVQLVLIPFFIFGIPFLMYRGIRFTARVTSYRNVRFDFVGTYGGAMKTFVLGTLVTLLSLGLAGPVASRWSADYLVNNLRYGGRPFAADLKLGAFYRAFVLPYLIAVGGLVVGGALVAVLMFQYRDFLSEQMSSGGPEAQIGLIAIFYAGFILFGIVGAIASIFYRAAIRNLVYNSTVIDGRHALESRVGRGRILWIVISNTIVTLLTIGLMRPWAAVRMSRYLASVTAMRSRGDLGAYHEKLLATRGVTAAEYMDVEGIQVGFGF